MSNFILRPVCLLIWAMALCKGIAVAAESNESAPPRLRPLTDIGHLEDRATDIPPYEVLMTADTIARFDGIFDMPKWAPPGQGPATRRVAVFSIIDYTHYAKPGPYGDERAPLFMVSMEKPPFCQYTSALHDIAALKPGDVVRLCWMHIYVDQNGSRYPERPVTFLQPARVPEGARMPPPYVAPDADRQPRPLMRATE